MPDVVISKRLSIGIIEYKKLGGQPAINLARIYDGQNKTVTDLTADQAWALADLLREASAALRVKQRGYGHLSERTEAQREIETA